MTIYEKMNDVVNPYYDRIIKNKLLHIDGFGYFVIQDYEEAYEDKVHNKTIIAYSAEYMLNGKGINLTFVTTAGNINNTSSTTVVTSNYFFYRVQQPEKSLLHQLIKVVPLWSIGYVSPSLMTKSRSFSETDKGLYGFLTNEVSQSYEALFVFDNENFTINAYDTTEVVKNTNIMLSFDNLIKNATVSELSDDVYTVINVSGAENLTIAKINPNGTKKLFCLDYYTGVLDKNATNYYENYNEWITDNALKKKVLEWERDCKTAIYDTSSTSYGSWTALQKKFNLLLLTQQAELTDMQSYYDAASQNMSQYTDYPDVDSIPVYAKWVGFLFQEEQGWVTYGEAKKNDYEILDSSGVKTYTTDDRHTVTLYTYWKNYAQACETNLKILKNGGRLYSVRKADFESTESINPDYNIPASSTVQATGKIVSAKVENHSVNPSGGASKYAIEALNTELKFIQSERDKIVDKYSYDKHFTDAEKIALDPYIIEGSFSDDTFIVTDSMETKDYSNSETKVQVIDSSGDISVKKVGELTQNDTIMDDIYVAGQLVDAGYEKLKVVSQPSFSFELESANFFFIEKFKPFIDQLIQIEKDSGSLFGCIINVELDDGNWVYPYLQEIEINYEDPDSFTMKFGNRFRLSNDTYTFNELHNETTSAVSSVGSLLSAVSQPVVNGTIDAVTSYMKTALNLANQSIKATEDNEFTFGSYGIKGRQKSDKDGNINGYSPEQLWISNNKICFTNDGWTTTKAVFGKVLVDGKESYGLIADSIVGSLIMGNNLIISNSNKTFTMNEDGLTVKNDTITMNMNPDSGFGIVKKTGAGNIGVFNVDKSGNLTITGGKIIVGDGTSTGYIIDGAAGTMTSIKVDSSGHPLFRLNANGRVESSGITIGGNPVITPGPDITPSGSDGVVNSGGDVSPGDFWAWLDWFFNIFKNPYDKILSYVGKRDSDGWRGIWQYYSARSLGRMFRDIRDANIYLVEQRTMEEYVSKYNNEILATTYINRTELNNYKTWADTQEVLKGYQTHAEMNSYYPKTETDNNFVLKSALNSYSTTEQINEKFGISDSDRFKKQTITVDGVNYTVLVLEEQKG
nr:MAG TPA: tail protein [Caudoviricetes sp.]